MEKTALSIIIPALNEAAGIEATLAQLSPPRQQGAELVVVDGGSTDGTPALAAGYADKVVSARRGRAQQLNAGAAAASGDILWFVHADTRIPADATDQLLAAVQQGGQWGRFDVRLSGERRLFRVIAWLMNHRSRLERIATGDQGIFVTRALFEAVDGFPEIALMEDIELSKRLRRRAAMQCLPGPLVTSSRRWEVNGPWRTILLMWRLRLAHWWGVPPERLAVHYNRQKGRG